MAKVAFCKDFLPPVGLNFKIVLVKSEFNGEFTFCHRNHPGSSNGSDMFANSSGKFQVKVRFNLCNGRQKGQAQTIQIYGIALRRGVEQRNR